MSRDIGYVVIEFNQASGQPITRGDIYPDLEDAEDVMDQCRAETAAIGRRERYAVATLTIEDDE